jgi:hypothetical protein
MSRAQLEPGIHASGFEFTAHLSWPGFDDVGSEGLAFSDWASNGPLAEVLAAARDQLRCHFRARVDERRREQVAEWRRGGIYPYAGDAADEKERTERETFDAVATTVFQHLPKSQGTRRTTFALLRSVLAHEPSDVLRIANELFTLSKQERDELNRLLKRTTLSALIKASTGAADRIDFLAALEHLVFAPEVKQRVTERDELHRILEDQCWVFGEEYALHVSNRSLNVVLAEHCKLLGRDAPTPKPVLREDGRPGRVDLMLSRAARHRKGERHHPKALRQMAHQVDRVPGCAVSTPHFRITVKTWGEIIEDYQERLRFHSEQLEYQSSTEHAMDYLVRNHGDAVAELVADGTIPGARSGDGVGVAP